jgi:predicted kinase
MNPIYLVVGPPAVGKSTTSRALAAQFPKSIHIPVDDLRNMVVSGLLLPSAVWSDDLAQQITLARTTVSFMALAYQKAGFAVVIDDFWGANHASDYQGLLDQMQATVSRIVLFPTQEEAHQRNLQRSGDSPARPYIDEGIRIVYQQLTPALPQLEKEGWFIVDTTALRVDEVVNHVLSLTASRRT